MIDEKYQELINRAIDETLTPDEQADLVKYLQTNPEARRYYDQLRRTVAALSDMPPVQAPADFKATVMDSIRHRSGEQIERARTGVLARIAGGFRSGTAWRYSYAFAAGLACGILILAAVTYFSNTSAYIDATQVSGTMSPVLAQTTALIGKKDIELNGILGTIEVRRGDGIVIIAGDLPSPNETTIELSYDPNDLAPASIGQPEPYTGAISTAQNAINLLFPGDSRFTIVFRDKSPLASTVACRISSGGAIRTVDLKTETSTQ